MVGNKGHDFRVFPIRSPQASSDSRTGRGLFSRGIERHRRLFPLIGLGDDGPVGDGRGAHA